MSTKTVEMVLEGRWVTGDLAYAGGPRRLVDILNHLDDGIAVLHNAEIDGAQAAQELHRFESMQVNLNSLLFAIPIGGDLQQADAFERVPKVPVEATLALPGYELTGSVYLVPGADPEATHMIGTRHFVPMTGVTITCCAPGADSRERHVAVVNMARASLFAVRSRVSAIA